MSGLVTSTQLISITSALLGTGGMVTLSLIDVPQYQSQPGERSLPSLRWMFSRGSHLFPQSVMAASAGFAFLAFHHFPSNLASISQLFDTSRGLRASGYIAATGLALAIIPFTRFVMVPNNFALMNKNEEHGGTRSAKSAQVAKEAGIKLEDRTQDESVRGKGEANEFTDLSGPQEKTPKPLTPAEDAEVREMLGKFATQNLWRAALLGASGVLALFCAVH